MSHYELIQMAKGLGLIVETERFRNESFRRTEHLYIFRTQASFTPHFGYAPGDRIATFKYHPDMEPMEYQDACGILYNTLKQFESWR